MKYQSELINEILEQRGHEKSSLHYESECIEQWIDENEGAYPKLCDYQSEWLNYIEENPIGKFPYETITNVTEATVDNVVPFAYKSAILSGNTLVNLAVNGLNKTYIQENSLTKLSYKMKPNKLYLLIIDVKENTLNKPFRFSGYALGKNATILTESEISGDKDVLNVGETGRKCFKVGYTEIPEGAGESLIMYCDNATDGTLTGSATYNIMFLEYQEGLENWDIPYFEGMQSVKMPVLTTSGKNLFHIDGKEIFSENNLHQIQNDEVIMENTTYGYYNCVIKYFNLKPNGIYTISYDSEILSGTPYDIVVVQDDQANKLNIDNGTFTAPLNGKVQVKFYSGSDNKIGKVRYYNIQIEEGSTATLYEPYKSNILTVNEPVELHGIDDVKDELDCLTGEVTGRIGGFILDGSDDELIDIYKQTDNNTMAFSVRNMLPNEWYQRKIICDKLSKVNTVISDVESYSHGDASSTLYIRISKSKLTSLDVTGFRNYLSSNPLTFEYELATESVKTVDLSVTNQDGETLAKLRPIEGTMHIVTDGTPLKPSTTMEIPVEATTQNLMSFIEE